MTSEETEKLVRVLASIERCQKYYTEGYESGISKIVAWVLQFPQIAGAYDHCHGLLSQAIGEDHGRDQENHWRLNNDA